MNLLKIAQFLLSATVLCGVSAFAQPSLVERIGTRLDNGQQRRSERIPDRYIVLFKEGVGQNDRDADDVLNGSGGRVFNRYRNALRGFSANIPAGQVAAIRRHPNVLLVEEDVTVNADQSLTTQTPATWGLDRVDQRALLLDKTYTYDKDGAGVTAYIVDTGIRASHADFVGRITTGFNAFNDANGTNDCDGHGTHVAGTVGGTVYGVAKKVNLSPVRVLDCTGSGAASGVIAGLNWIAANATPGKSVVNMSLGAGASTAMDMAVSNLIARGIPVVVSAGNSSANACNVSPARVPGAITVGATTNTDARASYSNFGSCVDLFAPGSMIVSNGIASDTATATLSGTSMASPHVAGVVALLLSGAPGLSPATVSNALAQASTPNVVTGAGTGSPNRLLHSFVTPPVVQDVAVANIAGSSARSVLNWRATATVTVKNLTNASSAPAGVTVTGNFNNGTALSCVTAANGACSVTSGTFNNRTTPVRFTVTNLSGADLRYLAGQNSATFISIAR